MFDLEFDYEVATSVLQNSEKDIEELQQWIQRLDKSKCVPKNITNKQLVLFYNACDENMNNTKICIEKYYIYRRNSPEFFNHRVFTSEGLRTIAETCELFSFPGKSFDGSEVLFHRLYDYDYTKYNFEDFCKLLFMIVDLTLYKRGPQTKYMYLQDMEGSQLGHILKMNIFSVRKLLQFVQEAMLVRIKAIHIINANALIDKVMPLWKPFINKELYEMIHIHKKGSDLEKIFEKIIPKSSLPKDYGGYQPECQVLHKQTVEELKAMETYFKNEEIQRVTALADQPRTDGNEGIQGCFKKLEID